MTTPQNSKLGLDARAAELKEKLLRGRGQSSNQYKYPAVGDNASSARAPNPHGNGIPLRAVHSHPGPQGSISANDQDIEALISNYSASTSNTVSKSINDNSIQAKSANTGNNVSPHGGTMPPLASPTKYQTPKGLIQVSRQQGLSGRSAASPCEPGEIRSSPLAGAENRVAVHTPPTAPRHPQHHSINKRSGPDFRMPDSGTRNTAQTQEGAVLSPKGNYNIKGIASASTNSNRPTTESLSRLMEDDTDLRDWLNITGYFDIPFRKEKLAVHRQKLELEEKKARIEAEENKLREKEREMDLRRSAIGTKAGVGVGVGAGTATVTTPTTPNSATPAVRTVAEAVPESQERQTILTRDIRGEDRSDMESGARLADDRAYRDRAEHPVSRPTSHQDHRYQNHHSHRSSSRNTSPSRHSTQFTPSRRHRQSPPPRPREYSPHRTHRHSRYDDRDHGRYTHREDFLYGQPAGHERPIEIDMGKKGGQFLFFLPTRLSPSVDQLTYSNMSAQYYFVVNRVNRKLDTRFFIVKSFNEQNVFDCMRNGIWATQVHNVRTFTQAFDTCRNVILIFSINQSKAFQGFARMQSPPSPTIEKPHWLNNITWDVSDPFRVQWLSKVSVDFYRIGHIKNPFNENSPVLVGKDGQEIEEEAGRRLIEEMYAIAGVTREPGLHRRDDSGGGGGRGRDADFDRPIKREDDDMDRRW
ncbi:hypothetical protein OQA88_9056 [Cercophora sp. LCS_1]